MTVMKCDRCGKYYDEITKCEVSGEYITGVATIIGLYRKDPHRRYDLCNDCRNSFYIWLTME